MTTLRVLFKGTLLKEAWVLKRYLFNTAMMIVAMYVFFMLIFFGGQAAAPELLADSLEALIVGYFVWTMAIRSYQTMSSDITREAQWGTLEQIHLSPYGIGRVVLVLGVVNVLLTVLIGSTILATIAVTTRTWLSINFLTVGTLVVLTIAPAIGLGLVFGGLALVYKRVGQAASLLQIAFVFFVGVPISLHYTVQFLPLALGTSMLQEAMTAGTRLWEFPVSDLLVLATTVVVYVGGGYAVFQYLQNEARKRGVLGHY